MLTLAKMHLQRVCVCSRRFEASRDNNLFQLRKYCSKSKADVRGLHLRYFSTRRRGLRDCSLIPRPANMTPSPNVSALKRVVAGGRGGCVGRPLSSVRKAHFRDKDRLMKNSSWARWLEVGQTSANGGGRLRPIPRSTTAVIKTTAAARLSGGLACVVCVR